MIQFSIMAADMLRWARLGEEIAKETPRVLARALNAIGDQAAERAMSEIEDESQGNVRPLMTVREADDNDLSYEFDARQAVATGTEWGREWPEAADNRTFSAQLYKVVTSGDGDVCEICEEIARGGPYTAAEINNMGRKWAHWHPPATVKGVRSNLIHPNCRCSPQPWRSMRRIPVTMGPRGSGRTQMMTPQQLGKALAEAVHAMIRIKMGKK